MTFNNDLYQIYYLPLIILYSYFEMKYDVPNDFLKKELFIYTKFI